MATIGTDESTLGEKLAAICDKIQGIDRKISDYRIACNAIIEFCEILNSIKMDKRTRISIGTDYELEFCRDKCVIFFKSKNWCDSISGFNDLGHMVEFAEQIPAIIVAVKDVLAKQIADLKETLGYFERCWRP